jgi:hypothetical protein
MMPRAIPEPPPPPQHHYHRRSLLTTHARTHTHTYAHTRAHDTHAQRDGLRQELAAAFHRIGRFDYFFLCRDWSTCTYATWSWKLLLFRLWLAFNYACVCSRRVA